MTIYSVNSANDSLTIAADGQLTLREAIQAASTNAPAGDAPAGSAAVTDIIKFAAGLAGQTITLAGAELALAGNTTITGLGANRLTISGNNASRVFNVGVGGTVGISGLTVTGGSTGIGVTGGGISNAGTLVLSKTAVVANAAGGLGGGIHTASGSTTRLDDCTVSGNTTTEQGAGIGSNGTLLISNSTISGNSAGLSGGGIAANTATLRNVTIFGNRADADGNSVGSNGGIRLGASGVMTIHNTLIAGNLRGSGAGVADDVTSGSTFVAGSSHNLIGDAATAGGLVDGTNGNIVGASLTGLIDPVLRDNGGPTKTHALLPNSEAIDAGDNAQALTTNGGALGFDQRGSAFRRVQLARVDIGAFEIAPAADLVGFINGQWWAGSSNGSKFTTALWATVPNSAFDALGEADFTGDGKADAFTLLDGAWRVGTSDGTTFTFAFWSGWANADWQDVKAGDLNGDRKADILARLDGQWWASLSNGTSFDAPTLWTTWVQLDYREFFLGDVNDDGKGDLIGYQQGHWWVGVSNGTSFNAPKLFATWADLPWQKLLVLDVNHDLDSDVAGFLSGEWWVGLQTGAGDTSAFTTSLAVRWANVPFVDLLSGDFDGDARDDLIGRNGGNWFVSLSTSPISGASFAAPTLYATWSNLAWKDVRVADFDGDSRDDVTGRFNGQWWVAESNGAGGAIATTTLWATWSELAWKAIGAVDATGTPGDGTGAARGRAFAAGESSGGSARAFASELDDEPLAVFWSKSETDEELAAGLLAAA